MSYYNLPMNGKDCAKVVTESINRVFANREPWQIVTITTTTVLSGLWFWTFLNQDESIFSRTKRKFFNLAKKVPYVQRRIERELRKAKNDFEAEIVKNCKGLTYTLALPEEGLDSESILQLVDDHLKCGNYNWKNGRVSGAVYGYNEEIVKLITQVYGKASYTNPLHPDIFPGICKMEAEIIRMACSLFNGNDETCGSVTTGGTESILMACKAYRDYAKDKKGITKPNMVVPKTAHAAFDKAAQYFKIHIRYIDINPITMEADVKAMKRAINKNTILLVGSAPNFPYGTMDDIKTIAKLGLKYNIPVHVDACLGSFIVALAKLAGYQIKAFDFSVKGVTSISADTHKYGFAPKGSSVILYSNQKYRNYQYTVTTDWPGGVYGSPSVNGSRAGGIIAACWATMMSYGMNGYLAATKRILDISRYIEIEIRKVNGIFIFGRPATTVIAIGSNAFDILRLSDGLCKLGWNLNNLQFPSGIHICITDMHTAPGIADKFLNDFRNCVTEIMKNPGKPVEGRMAIYGMAQSLSDRSVVGEVTRCFLNAMYYTPKLKKASN